MDNKAHFMSEAIRLSLEAMREGKGGPFGTVIVKDNKIIGRGCNEVTSTNDPTAHAEIMAIRQACKVLGSFQLEGCEIYTSCEPCPMCLGALYWARPSKIYYANTKNDAAAIGFDDAFIDQELLLPPSERKLPMEQLMREESIKVFEAWKLKENKIDY